MPRIYYNQTDHDIQLTFFLVHIIVYTVITVIIWLRGLFAPVPLTIVWTLLLAYQSYWRVPITDGTQIRTYNRLRNRFGKDWDLAASREEFDLERKKALLELKLRHILPDTVWVLPVNATIAGFLWLTMESVAIEFVMASFAGWLLVIALLQLILRLQLRDTRQRYDRLKKKQLSSGRDTEKIQALQVKPGNTLAVGDDGEFIEVPQQNHQETS